MTIVPVPDDLKARFAQWVEDGRLPQESFKWRTASWKRKLPGYSVLDDLANPVGRADVVRWFENIDSPAAALDAYIASYIWGYAHANIGPYRAAEVIIENSTPKSDRDFATDLFELARVAQTEGGVAAYDHVAALRGTTDRFFHKWGPSFGTKFISFATMGAPAAAAVAVTPILDDEVTRWFNRHTVGVERLKLDWRSPGSYRRYVDTLAGWADELGITPDQVEQVIFVPTKGECRVTADGAPASSASQPPTSSHVIRPRGDH